MKALQQSEHRAPLDDAPPTRPSDASPVDRWTAELPSGTDALRRLAGLPRADREHRLSVMVTGAARAGSTDAASAALRKLRAVLREPMSFWPASDDDPEVVSDLRITRIDRTRFCVSARWAPPHARWGAYVVSPEGERLRLALDRTQLHQPGAALVELTCPSAAPDGWLLEVDVDGSPVGEAPFAAVDSTADAVRLSLARAWATNEDERVVAAAATWRARMDAEARREPMRFGQTPAPHRAAVLVDVGGCQHLEHHLCTAFGAPPPQGVGLVYVVRDSVRAEQLRELGSDLYDLYRVPFTITLIPPGMPFSVAHVAASGDAPALVVVSADLVPVSESWLTDLLDAFEAAPGAGVVTTKLLDLGGSIVSAGWQVDPTGAMLPRLAGTAPSTAVRACQVPAGGPGCFVVSAPAYRSAVAASPPFLGDDLDAFDLSLRLSTDGCTNWFVPVEFHVAPLEAPRSITDVARFDRTLFGRSWPFSSFGPVVRDPSPAIGSTGAGMLWEWP